MIRALPDNTHCDYSRFASLAFSMDGARPKDATGVPGWADGDAPNAGCDWPAAASGAGDESAASAGGLYGRSRGTFRARRAAGPATGESTPALASDEEAGRWPRAPVRLEARNGRAVDIRFE